MKQYEAVIEAMRLNGGYATLGRLYLDVFKITDVVWNTKTPEASIRRIVQERPEFYKIKPGLWGLVELRNIKRDAQLQNEELSESTHTDYQGLLVEIGNWKQKETFVPSQDKNRHSLMLQQTLGNLAALKKIYPFTYDDVVARASTIDVLWFNHRRMPDAAFEIEHSTDMQNSLAKFAQLQDFNILFFIVGHINRESLFKKTIAYHVFEPIRSRVKFMSYDDTLSQHEIAGREFLLHNKFGI